MRKEREDCHPVERKPTGIRRTNTGAWAAIREGRFVREYSGAGSKARAIQAAGSNARVA